MAKLGINTGVAPNDGLGDTLLEGAIKINGNFDELYSYFGNGSNLTVAVLNKNLVGVHTLSNVGVGTTNPTSRLTVLGDITATDISVAGVVTATKFFGDIDGNNGNFTGIVTASSFSGDGSGLINLPEDYVSYWKKTSAGIHTTSNVGIGSTIPTSRLVVTGDARISGVVTANSFIKFGGTSIQFLKADGSLDSNTYLTTTGSGSNLSGIVTSLIAGSNITLSASTGQVTISSSYLNYWDKTSAGINTTSNVGIGSTIPTSKLTVTGDIRLTGVITATDFNATSDIKLKDNISIIENPLDTIVKLNGVNFNWKDTGRKSLGVIAQEVEQVLPELVSGEEIKTVNYNGIIGLLIECIKKQQEEIERLKLNNK